jgi:20S proteasome alpha/beta subunit
MTIALGMRIGDGLIFAADRLLSTDRHHFMDRNRKVTVYPLNHGAIFFAFADSPVAAKEVRQKIETRLVTLDTPDYPLSIADIGQITETVINEIYANRLGAMPLQLLIGGAVPGEGTQMWVYDGEGGFNIGGEFIVLGAGESSLIRYLEAAYSRQDSLEAGKDVAIYLIHQAEQFIPGCKGIDVIAIPNALGSEIEDWDWLRDDEIGARLQRMIGREKDHLRKIITG